MSRNDLKQLEKLRGQMRKLAYMAPNTSAEAGVNICADWLDGLLEKLKPARKEKSLVQPL